MKKGFTIVEIILSIGLIVLVGTVSIFSFNIIKKNNIKITLNKMSEEIYNAVNLYVETNSEVKKELYNNSNGVKIPLKTLENAGLVDFGKLNDEDIEDEFVVTMLGTSEEDDDHCANTYTAKSWDIKSGETIYICEKSNGSQNLVTVAGDADNLSKATRDVFYFKGKYPSNYIQLKGDDSKIYRILSIDKDDSITLFFDPYTKEQYARPSLITTKVLDQTFSSISEKQYGGKYVAGLYYESYYDSVFIALCSEYQQPNFYNRYSETVFNANLSLIFSQQLENSSSELFITELDYLNTFECGVGSWMPDVKYVQTGGCTSDTWCVVRYFHMLTGSKIRLKPCMKIISGTGNLATPYILENNCPKT